jgi:hypothetical protein
MTSKEGRANFQKIAKGTIVNNLLLNHDETYAKINIDTGEITAFEIKSNATDNNMPLDKMRVRYKEFSVVDTSVLKKIRTIFTPDELSVLIHFITISEFNTNSLKPFGDDLSLRELALLLDIKKDKVKSIINKLFTFGVFMSVKIYKEEAKTYWVLNPNISWKGRLIDKALFYHFDDCMVTKLLK